MWRRAVLPVVTMLTVLLPGGQASTHPGGLVTISSSTAATGDLWSAFSLACPKVGQLCDDGPNIPWSFTSATDVVVHPGSPAGAGSARVSGSGTLTGWCDHAVGTGFVTVQNPIGVSHTFQVRLQLQGSLVGEYSIRWVFTDVSVPSRLAMTMNGRTAGNSGTHVKCVTSPATSYTFTGVAAGLAG